jgi:uncharacterized protein (DUF305 family)
MNRMKRRFLRTVAVCPFALVIVAATPAITQARTHVDTHRSRLAAPEARADTTRLNYTAADVHFMQGMIAHHAQALVMTSMVPSRTTNKNIRLIAQRIEISQRDEIGLMQRWLRDRNETVPEVDAAHIHYDSTSHHDMAMPGMDMSEHALMPGMLTREQLAQLAATSGTSFDRLFLKDMIGHHKGALTMVAKLLSSTGAAQDPEVFQFASDVDAGQRAEIMRMSTVLAALDDGTPQS